MIGNKPSHYGLIHIMLHWSMAGIIFFLFASGLYMVTLGYYDPGYNTWPHWHKSSGILLSALLLTRIAWILIQPRPRALPSHTRMETTLAHITHGLMYLLMLTLVVTGYLIATAKGSQISVFGWFSLPPVINADNKAVLLGQIHLYTAWSLIGLVGLHAAGAIKHAVIDRDATLRRMLLPKS